MQGSQGERLTLGDEISEKMEIEYEGKVSWHRSLGFDGMRLTIGIGIRRMLDVGIDHNLEFIHNFN